MGGSIWEGEGRLEEVLSLGSAEGPPETLFGQVAGLASSSSYLYVLDNQVPAVRVFDRAGTYLKTVGGEGQGPGEYVYPWSIAVDEVRGHLYVRDDRMSRIAVFDLEGEFLENWQTDVGFMSNRPMVVDSDHRLYSTVVLDARIDHVRMGMASFGPGGALGDTLAEPVWSYEPPRLWAYNEEGAPLMSAEVPFTPQREWAVTPGRAVVSGTGEDCRITVDLPGGTRRVIERVWDPVEVLPDEAAWYRERLTADLGQSDPGWTWDGQGIPDHKPAFRRLIPDRAGRIWVQRYGSGRRIEPCAEDPEDVSDYRTDPCWEHTWVLDVFRITGEYLGEATVPEGMQFSPWPWITQDELLAVVEGPDGVPRVKLYRIETPEG